VTPPADHAISGQVCEAGGQPLRQLAVSTLSSQSLEPLFAVIVAAIVATSIPWVGLLVINSLLILPSATARNLAWNTRSYVAGALAISLLSGLLGMVCSYYWDTATGATIVLWASGFFSLFLISRR
jgi:zinc transport system permease protein